MVELIVPAASADITPKLRTYLKQMPVLNLQCMPIYSHLFKTLEVTWFVIIY